MSDHQADETTNFLIRFIKECRDITSNLPSNRLPKWLSSARVRYGWINDTLICVFEDSSTLTDEYKYTKYIFSDVTVLLRTEDFVPNSYHFRINDGQNLLVWQGDIGHGSGGTIFNLQSEYSSFLNCGYSGHHQPVILVNFFFEHSPPSKSNMIVAASFVPFALYIHKREVQNSIVFWNNNRQMMLELFLGIEKMTGDYYQALNTKHEMFVVAKQKTIIVFGKDSNETSIRQLEQLRDYLTSVGYEASLLKSLPEISSWSNEEKARLWGSAARFCVILDITPSGHIVEYEYMKQQRQITIVLRPNHGGSSWMISDASLADINYIKEFFFKDNPLVVLGNAIEWAESYFKAKERTYGNYYPWRT